ncbi:phospholipase A2 inhibitor gamma subunit B-like [Rhinoderma darwinii]|uniref:phospholipase A2 inhibitor gamma subunit B-like n=1 Tax=Rhinoderma darwinii TaxID=43563 RepID=UPI003F66DE6A
MRLFITLLGTICILPLAAFALECIQCIGKNSDSCDGPSVVCKKAKECMVLSEFLHFDQVTFHIVQKDCNEMYPCGKTLYVSNQYELTLRVHINCCEGDNCNTFNYNTPPANVELKGKYCPSCGGYGLRECKNKQRIQCEEEKDQCYEYFGKVIDPAGNVLELNTKGCISLEGCVLGFKYMVGVTELASPLFNCIEPVENF